MIPRLRYLYTNLLHWRYTNVRDLEPLLGPGKHSGLTTNAGRYVANTVFENVDPKTENATAIMMYVGTSGYLVIIIHRLVLLSLNFHMRYTRLNNV